MNESNWKSFLPNKRRDWFAVGFAVLGLLFLFGSDIMHGLDSLRTRFRNSITEEIPISMEIARLQEETNKLIPDVKNKALLAHEKKTKILEQRDFIRQITEKIETSNSDDKIAEIQQKALEKAQLTLGAMETEFVGLVAELQTDLWRTIALDAERRHLASMLERQQHLESQHSLDEEFAQLAQVAKHLQSRLELSDRMNSNEAHDLLSLVNQLNENGDFVPPVSAEVPKPGTAVNTKTDAKPYD